VTALGPEAPDEHSGTGKIGEHTEPHAEHGETPVNET
jgi:hypothetical protein